ncbi:organic solute transporter subunit beta [Fukomys damarensis]|nr:organic solute transporter subunit beta [Fukomys damarensis]
MDQNKEAIGAPAGTPVPQELLEEMIWFFRVEDASAWNYSILALTVVVVVLSMFLLVRSIQANRNRKLQPQKKDTPEVLRLNDSRTRDGSLNNLGETLLTKMPALAPPETELKQQCGSVVLPIPSETES